MDDEQQPAEPQAEPAATQTTWDLTFDTALANAARLLIGVETETNIPLMGQVRDLADSWISIASLLDRQ